MFVNKKLSHRGSQKPLSKIGSKFRYTCFVRRENGSALHRRSTFQNTIFFKTENTVHKILNAYFVISFPFTSKPHLFYLAFLTKQDTHIYLVQFCIHRAQQSCRVPPLLTAGSAVFSSCAHKHWTMHKLPKPNGDINATHNRQNPTKFQTSSQFLITFLLTTYLYYPKQNCIIIYGRMTPSSCSLVSSGSLKKYEDNQHTVQKTFPTIQWISFLSDSKTLIFHARVMLLSSESK